MNCRKSQSVNQSINQSINRFIPRQINHSQSTNQSNAPCMNKSTKFYRSINQLNDAVCESLSIDCRELPINTAINNGCSIFFFVIEKIPKKVRRIIKRTISNLCTRAKKWLNERDRQRPMTSVQKKPSPTTLKWLKLRATKFYCYLGKKRTCSGKNQRSNDDDAGRDCACAEPP